MEKETTELVIWLKTFFVFVSALLSAVFFFIYLNRYIIFNRAAGGNASLTFVDEAITVDASGLCKTQLVLNTDNTKIRGTDVKIAFDTSKLELVHILPQAKQSSSLKTYLPIKNNEFDYQTVIRQANQTGQLAFSAITADMEKGLVTAPFQGIAILAQLTFRSIQPGKTIVSFIHIHPSHDSNIVDTLNPPNNILMRTNKLEITTSKTK